jgi:transcriptional regulator with XRE-family HTH domain
MKTAPKPTRKYTRNKRTNIKLEYIRKRSGLSITAFCFFHGISEQGLSRLLNDKGSSPHIVSVLKKLGYWHNLQVLMLATNDYAPKPTPISEAVFNAVVLSKLPTNFRDNKKINCYTVHTGLGTLFVEVDHSHKQLTLWTTEFSSETSSRPSYIVGFIDY